MFSLVPYRPVLSRQNRNRFGMLEDPFFRSFMNLDDVLPRGQFRVDIREVDDNYLLEAELPGVAQDQISISLTDDVLTIEANTDAQREEKQEGYTYIERRTGYMKRSFNLEGIDQERISADHQNGILTVTLPKQAPVEKQATRQITIGQAVKQDVQQEGQE